VVALARSAARRAGRFLVFHCCFCVSFSCSGCFADDGNEAGAVLLAMTESADCEGAAPRAAAPAAASSSGDVFMAGSLIMPRRGAAAHTARTNGEERGVAGLKDPQVDGGGVVL